MIIDCDYVRDSRNNIYIVRGYWDSDPLLVNRVFSPSSQGTRYNKELGVMFEKVIEKNHVPTKLPLSEVVQIYKPRDKVSGDYKELKGVWRDILNSIIDVGVPIGDLGIFGSYLIGFPIAHDIDFVVYGMDNLLKIRNNIDFIRKNTGTKPISRQHIEYQARVHGSAYSSNNSFQRMLENKWSSLQVNDKTLTTIRFAYKESEIPENPFASPMIKDFEVEGAVAEDIYTNFSPRVFDLVGDDEKYRVATYFWIYQSAVRKGGRIKVRGALHENGTISLCKFDHWINYPEGSYV